MKEENDLPGIDGEAFTITLDKSCFAYSDILVKPKVISDLEQEIMSNFYTILEEKLLESVIVNAVPKIKLPITRGKLKWRGIKMIIQGEYQWLEQRGKVISDKINMSYSWKLLR